MIEVIGLTKKYGSNTVVDHLDFTITENQVFGFLGPNGAGKSTTMNMITGCLAATEGTVRINGHDIYKEPTIAKREIGYLPEIPPLYLDFTPVEYLQFVGEARGLSKAEIREQIPVVMERAHISHMKDRLIKNLSKGYKQRVGLAQAILGEPRIIILDEPTVGLDPKQILEIRDLIRELGKSHIVLFSSHILSEVSNLCDKVIILSKGKLMANCAISELTDKKENLEDVFLEMTEETSGPQQ